MLRVALANGGDDVSRNDLGAGWNVHGKMICSPSDRGLDSACVELGGPANRRGRLWRLLGKSQRLGYGLGAFFHVSSPSM